jgi:hypothetical protein
MKGTFTANHPVLRLFNREDFPLEALIGGTGHRT